MTCKQLVSGRIKNRLGPNRCLIVRGKISNSITICAFKCSDCGEDDEDIAEKYCGNSGCKYRI